LWCRYLTARTPLASSKAASSAHALRFRARAWYFAAAAVGYCSDEPLAVAIRYLTRFCVLNDLRIFRPDDFDAIQIRSDRKTGACLFVIMNENNQCHEFVLLCFFASCSCVLRLRE
jgi:hypothetical protein